MAQYIIPETFADDTGFVEGLTPTISIRQRDDKNLVYSEVVNTTMEDKGDGDYVYVFYGYQKDKLYNRKIDGGSDDLTSRYSQGNNELDYYSNKEDYGLQFRGAIGGYVNHLDKRMDKVDKLILELKEKDIDFTDIIEILNEIKNKEYPEYDNSEILEKIEEKDKSVDIISAVKENGSNLQKSNKENGELVANLIEQIKSDREIIESLKKYIEKLIKRGDVRKDMSFKNLVKDIKINEEDIKMIMLESDPDFKSLISK